jgi:hypothetical protein
VNGLQELVVPSSNNAPGGPKARFKDKRLKGWWKDGRGCEAHDIGEVRLLDAKNRWEEAFNHSMNIITLTASAKAMHIPAR